MMHPSPSPDRPSPHPRRLPIAAALVIGVCGLAIWVSGGSLAFVSQGHAARVGLLPPWWVPIAASGLLAAAHVTFGGAEGTKPLAFAGLLLLPWLPLPVPEAFLLWTGPLVWWVWAGTIAMAARSFLRRRVPGVRVAPWANAASAAALAFVIYCAAAWQVSAVLPGGDEPHYLVITQSVLSDGDIRIENNHVRGDYRQYFEGTLRPDYLRRGKDGQIYSIHAPGLSVLIAPAFAAGGYPAVVAFLALVSALGSLLAWLAGYRLTGSCPSAWFGWSVVTLTVPFFFHAFAVYPDATGAVLVMTGVLALVDLDRGTAKAGVRWMLHGLALAALPWLHTRYALAAGVLGACLALRLVRNRAWRSLAAFLVIPIVSAAAWFSFFQVVYGEWSPAAPYGTYTQSTLSNIPRALPALLLDQQFGVLPNAPAYAFALLGLAVTFRARRRLAVELSVLVFGYLAAVSAYHMWWGGWSAPARFAVPVLLALGLPAAAWWHERACAARAASLVGLGVSLLITGSLVLVLDGRLIFNTRDGYSRWLEWISPLVDLPRALPSFLRDGPAVALLQAGLWIAAMAAGGWTVAWAGRRGGRSRALPLPGGVPNALPVLTASVAFAVATMVALEINWRTTGTRPITATSAQLELLRAYDPAVRPLGVGYRPLGYGAASEFVPRLRISRSGRRPATAADPLLLLHDLPAGRYEVDLASVAAARGGIEATIGRSDRPLHRWLFEAGEGRPQLTLALPVAVNAVAFTGDERIRATVPALALRPVTVLPPAQRRVADRAWRAARYGSLTVLSFDDYAYLEEPGLWVRGGTPVRVMLSDEHASRTATLLVRNGPVPNHVSLQGGEWSASFALGPRAERQVDVPLVSGVVLLEVRTETGFRPSEAEPGSQDRRYLGVWIEDGK